MSIFERHPELEISTPAPDFRARTITGERVARDHFSTQKTLFIFVGVNCSMCASVISAIQHYAPIAKEYDKIGFVLVVENEQTEVQSFINKFNIQGMDIISAPRKTVDFAVTYNPQGFLPYFVLLDENSIVLSRGPVGMDRWVEISKRWDSIVRDSLASTPTGASKGTPRS